MAWSSYGSIHGSGYKIAGWGRGKNGDRGLGGEMNLVHLRINAKVRVLDRLSYNRTARYC